MARLPYLRAEDAPTAVAVELARLPPLHIFGLLAHAETVFGPWVRFGRALLTDLALDPALRELAILEVGRLAAGYEWDQHVPIALAAGVRREQVEAVERGEHHAACLTAGQRAVLEFTAALVAGEVDEATWQALRVRLGEREVVELALTAGHYLMLARVMTALRIDPEPPAACGRG